MALIKCTECGQMISDKAEMCPQCGCPMQNVDNPSVKETSVESQPSKNGKPKTWALVAVLLCLLVCGGYFAFAFFLTDSSKDSVVELTPDFIEAIQRYNRLGAYSEGMAAVQKDGKWGYINTQGEEIISCVFNNVGQFSEGKAAVQKDDMWGYVGTKGEEIIPLKIEAYQANGFSEDLAVIIKDISNFSVINVEGKIIFNGECDFSQFGEDMDAYMQLSYIKGKLYIPILSGKFAVYDKQGNKMEEIDEQSKYELDAQNRNKELYTKFVECEEGSEVVLTGLKDADEKVVVPAKYDFINTEENDEIIVSNGVVLVGMYEFKEDGEQVIHYGYADLKGNTTLTDDIMSKCKQSIKFATNTFDVEDEDNDMFWNEENSQANVSSNGEKVITINIKGEIYHTDLSSLEGNWGVHQNGRGDIWSDAMPIPQGKVWVFKDYRFTSANRILYMAGFIEKKDAKSSFGILSDLPSWQPLSRMNGERYYYGKEIILCLNIGGYHDERNPFSLEVNFIEKND